MCFKVLAGERCIAVFANAFQNYFNLDINIHKFIIKNKNLYKLFLIAFDLPLRYERVYRTSDAAVRNSVSIISAIEWIGQKLELRF